MVVCVLDRIYTLLIYFLKHWLLGAFLLTFLQLLYISKFAELVSMGL